MKVLVTGANGQLGYDVIKVLRERGVSHCGVDISDFDITDRQAVDRFLDEYQPDAVIHCAAYTAVDKAEEDVERCTAINVDGTRHIAQACKRLNAKLMYISTDYVFPGIGDKPYEVDDETGPESVYGKTKLAGEIITKELVEKHFIVRISWVFGKNGNNFVKTMLRIGKEQNQVNVVCDQIGSPTYTADLAPLVCDMIITEKYGIYHATNEGYCSWADFAEEIFRQAGYSTKVNRITTAEYPAKAKRPMNSRMSQIELANAAFVRLPVWYKAVKKHLFEIGEPHE